MGPEPVRISELPTGHFLDACAAEAGDKELGIYLVGSPGLGDLSPRQSNIDLVVVSERALPAERLEALRAVHHTLRLNGRDAAVCYTTWDSLAGAPADAEVAVYEGR